MTEQTIRHFMSRCPKCGKWAMFPLDKHNWHHCSNCCEEFSPMEILGWMQL